ncbi:hypothetical protein PR202_gb14412 [Eleusine coracana subsp. coracana]|uniref:Uncharacterized protein n=1 Tax=Eleusine coracana subsp. coracana TaxID=191504 RepID=A0AAV5EV05_ELECO|nr:hypothetical protein PR202_gb14412 [Eleusine coracana subsp. coracana]
MASSSFSGDVLITVTLIPNAFANLTATCPSPPRPITPTLLPGSFSPWYFIGVYTVIPAQSSGAPPSSGMPSGNRTTKRWFTTTMSE